MHSLTRSRWKVIVANVRVSWRCQAKVWWKIRDGVLWITATERNLLRTSVTCCEFKRLLDIQRRGASVLLGQNARFLAGGVSFQRGRVRKKTGLGFYSLVHSCCCNTEIRETREMSDWKTKNICTCFLILLRCIHIGVLSTCSCIRLHLQHFAR